MSHVAFSTVKASPSPETFSSEPVAHAATAQEVRKILLDCRDRFASIDLEDEKLEILAYFLLPDDVDSLDSNDAGLHEENISWLASAIHLAEQEPCEEEDAALLETCREALDLRKDFTADELLSALANLEGLIDQASQAFAPLQRVASWIREVFPLFEQNLRDEHIDPSNQILTMTVHHEYGESSQQAMLLEALDPDNGVDPFMFFGLACIFFAKEVLAHPVTEEEVNQKLSALAADLRAAQSKVPDDKIMGAFRKEIEALIERCQLRENKFVKAHLEDRDLATSWIRMTYQLKDETEEWRDESLRENKSTLLIYVLTNLDETYGRFSEKQRLVVKKLISLLGLEQGFSYHEPEEIILAELYFATRDATVLESIEERLCPNAPHRPFMEKYYQLKASHSFRNGDTKRIEAVEVFLKQLLESQINIQKLAAMDTWSRPYDAVALLYPSQARLVNAIVTFFNADKIPDTAEEWINFSFALKSNTDRLIEQSFDEQLKDIADNLNFVHRGIPSIRQQGELRALASNFVTAAALSHIDYKELENIIADWRRQMTEAPIDNEIEECIKGLVALHCFAPPQEKSRGILTKPPKAVFIAPFILEKIAIINTDRAAKLLVPRVRTVVTQLGNKIQKYHWEALQNFVNFEVFKHLDVESIVLERHFSTQEIALLQCVASHAYSIRNNDDNLVNQWALSSINELLSQLPDSCMNLPQLLRNLTERIAPIHVPNWHERRKTIMAAQEFLKETKIQLTAFHEPDEKTFPPGLKLSDDEQALLICIGKCSVLHSVYEKSERRLCDTIILRTEEVNALREKICTA